MQCALGFLVEVVVGGLFMPVRQQLLQLIHNLASLLEEYLEHFAINFFRTLAMVIRDFRCCVVWCLSNPEHTDQGLIVNR